MVKIYPPTNVINSYNFRGRDEASSILILPASAAPSVQAVITAHSTPKQPPTAPSNSKRPFDLVQASVACVAPIIHGLWLRGKGLWPPTPSPNLRTAKMVSEREHEGANIFLCDLCGFGYTRSGRPPRNARPGARPIRAAALRSRKKRSTSLNQ